MCEVLGASSPKRSCCCESDCSVMWPADPDTVLLVSHNSPPSKHGGLEHDPERGRAFPEASISHEHPAGPPPSAERKSKKGKPTSPSTPSLMTLHRDGLRNYLKKKLDKS